MSTQAPAIGCTACEIIQGTRQPVGGILLRRGGFAVHAIAAPSPLPGWLVIASERHARAIYELTSDESAALGTLMAEVMRAQREVLGAEHVYAFQIADQVQHCHVHLVPRFADTPDRLRGTRCFEARPEDALPSSVLTEAAEAVRRKLAP